MTEISDQYVAGFFDGEGTVFMQRHGAVEVRVTQVNQDPLHAMVERYGVGAIAPVAVGKNSVPCWQYRICNWVDAARFLRAIAPYLIVKRREVDLILDFVALREASGATVKHARPRTPEIRAAREQLWGDLRALKHPGRLRSKELV